MLRISSFKLGFVGEIVTQLFKVFARLFQKAAQVKMVSQTQPQSFLKETLGAEPRDARRNERNSLCMRRESEAEPQSRVATREIPCFLEHNA